jgi:hypothetical protein
LNISYFGSAAIKREGKLLGCLQVETLKSLKKFKPALTLKVFLASSYRGRVCEPFGSIRITGAMWIQTSSHGGNRSHCKQEGFHKIGRTKAKTKEIKPLRKLNGGIRGFIRESGIFCNESLRVQNKARDLT